MADGAAVSADARQLDGADVASDARRLDGVVVADGIGKRPDGAAAADARLVDGAVAAEGRKNSGRSPPASRSCSPVKKQAMDQGGGGRRRQVMPERSHPEGDSLGRLICRLEPFPCT